MDIASRITLISTFQFSSSNSSIIHKQKSISRIKLKNLHFIISKINDNMEKIFKVCLLGRCGVGKSSYLRRLTKGSYNQYEQPTVGVDAVTCSYDGNEVKVQLWDTTGNWRFTDIVELHVSGADGILFFVDVTDPSSLHDLQTRWAPMVQKMTPDMPRHRQVIIGLRTDLKKQVNEISCRAAEKFAANLGMPYIEASALGNFNIGDSFALLVANMHAKTPIYRLTPSITNNKNTCIEIPANEISIISKLGEGNYGEIFRAEWYGLEVVLKKYKVDPNLEEVNKATLLLHNHIERAIGITRDTNANEIMLVMEFMQHGSLEELLFPKHSTCQKVTLECQDVIQIALDIATGLKHLRSQNIGSPKTLQRSLSSSNIMLDKHRRAKLADIGTIKLQGAKSAAAAVGEHGTDFDGPNEEIKAKADIYSFGALLYEMLTNSKLNANLDSKSKAKNIKQNVANKDFQRLILNCCKKDSARRPSIERCIETLRKMQRKNITITPSINEVEPPLIDRSLHV